MSDKKERAMTPKGFLHKTTTKAAASASAFLEAHRAFLETGELASLTSPILRQVDDRSLMPTPALEAIKAVVLGHILALETQKVEERLASGENGTRTPKNWLATIYDKEGNICTRVKEDGKEVSIQQEFDQPQEADRWVDRRLFEGQTDWFGVVSHTTKTNKDGEPLSVTITRTDALARILAKKAGPVMKGQAKSSGKLGWGVKTRPSHAKFSHG